MKIFKRILILITVIVIITTTLIGSTQKNVNTDSNVAQKKLVRVAVLISSFDDVYISLVRQSLEAIQKENNDKVEFTFFDGKGYQLKQNEILDSVLKNKFDLLLLNLIDISPGSVEASIDQIKQQNVPVILFNVEPFITDSVKSYKKAVVIATNVEQSGILEGKLIVTKWNSDKQAIDINGDNILQYIMLTGERSTTLSIARTKYSISTINDKGIKTQQLALRVTEGTQESAKNTIDSLFLNYGTKIEAIIANDDTIALGAIKALQEYGYNNGINLRPISVVGINGIPEALDSIKKGFMTGTVVQDAPSMAKALYTVGMNLVANKNPLDGTDYKFDDSGVVIKLLYTEYLAQW